MPSDFEVRLESWRRAAFPEGSTDDDVDELHADLARWDSFVADLVIPFANGRPVRFGVVDIMGGLDELLGRLRELRANRDDHETVDTYERYTLLLIDLYAAAVAEAALRNT